MIGTVTIFNNIKGLGFIRAEAVCEKIFVHWSQVVGSGFQTLLPGWEVDFDLGRGEKGPQAANVRPLGTAGLVVNEEPEAMKLDSGIARLRVDVAGRIYALDGQPVRPHIAADNFRAYWTGRGRGGHVKGLEFRLPESNATRTFVLLDPQKNPRRIKADGFYSVVHDGSYVVQVEKDGRVLIHCVGRHHQPLPDGEPGENWLVLERRLEHRINPSAATVEEIAAELPTSGLARDNDGFAGGILRGLEWLRNPELSRPRPSAV